MTYVEDHPDVHYAGFSQEGAIKAALRELERLPLLMYRAEFPRNCFQAYAASGLQGPVVWFFTRPEDVDDDVDLFIPGFYDLACGISLAEFINHVAQFRNSGGNIEGKHGIGARLAALRYSPNGVEWWSLKDGQVNGLKMWIENDKFAYCIYEDYDAESVLHPAIIEAGHGTQVLFTGVEPKAAKDMDSEATAAWLSSRWYRHQPGIKLYATRCRQGDRGLVQVEVPTQEDALEALSEFKCDVQLSDALVRTYILKPNLEGVPRGQRYHYSGLYRIKDGGGERAKPRSKFYVVYEDEIYMEVPSKGVPGRLRKFGITHGHNRVAMLVFPSEEHYGPNDMRTRIEPLVQKNPTDVDLPTARWAKEFNELMPDELRQYVESCALGSDEQNMQIINDIIENHAKYLTGPARRRNVVRGEGDVEVNPKKTRGNGGQQEEREGGPPRKRRRRKVKGSVSTTNRKSSRFDAPKVRWVEPDAGDAFYHDSGDYLPHAHNGRGELQLNRNWKGLKRWQEQVGNAHPELTETMIQHYTEQATVVIHVDAIMRSKLVKLPDPGSDDFKNAMLLPVCRDMAFREIIHKSSLVRE